MKNRFVVMHNWLRVVLCYCQWTKPNYALCIVHCALFIACHESFDERLVREAHDQTRINCPRRVDPFTILDSITYSPESREWTYCYRFVDSLDQENLLSPTTLSDFHNRLRHNIINNIELKRLKQEGVTLVYSYRLESTGQEVIHEAFTKEDY